MSSADRSRLPRTSHPATSKRPLMLRWHIGYEVRLMAAGLAEAAGDAARAEVEGRRYEMLISSRES